VAEIHIVLKPLIIDLFFVIKKEDVGGAMATEKEKNFSITEIVVYFSLGFMITLIIIGILMGGGK